MKQLFISVFLTAAITSAWADKAPKEIGSDNREAAREFSSLDLNEDGAISKDEASSVGPLSTNFDKYDTNRDGRLEFGEYAKYDGSVETRVKGVDTPLDKKSN